MATHAHHERSSSSPPKMMTAFNSTDKPPQPKPKPKNLHRHHQSHHSIAPTKPLPTIIKPSFNDEQSSHSRHNSHATDPYSYARHLKKPLPQVPQNKEIELMVNSNDYQQDIEPDISDSDSFHNNEKTDEKTDEKMEIKQCICSIQCVIGFICNRYMKARCSLFCCNVLLILICFLFAMGQLYDVQLNNEIYISDTFIVDKDVLFSNDKRAFMDVISYENKTYKVWLCVSVFIVFLLWFIFCLMYFLWIFLVDLYNFMYGIYDKYKYDMRIGKQLTDNNYCQRIYPYCLCCFNCCKKRKCFVNMCRMYSNCLLECNYVCGLDVAVYVLALMVKNIIVLGIQILALSHYNGIGILSIGTDHLLAENMQFIIIYAIVIGIHQTIVGILWYFYICKHGKCNGRYFNLIIYCVNYIFYIFYVINPMVLIYTQYNGLYSLLFSNNFSLIQYLSIIIPLIFLSFMTYFGCLYFIRKTHQSWKYKFASKNYTINSNGYNDINTEMNTEYSNTGLTTTVMKANHSYISNISNTINDSIENEEERDDVLTPKNTMTINELDKLNNLELDVFAKKRIMDTFNDECCCKIFCNGKLLLDSKLEFLWLVKRKSSVHKYDHIQTIIINKHRKQQILRRLCIILYGIMCIIFGIFLIVFVLHHFTSVVNNDIICPSNYDFCQYKVYPFHGNKCECRILRIYDVNDINITAVNTMLTEFNMLEAIQIDLSKPENNTYRNLSQISLNVNSDHLRIIDVEGVSIENINNIVNVSPNIQYLRLYHAQIEQIPENFIRLYDIQYLNVGYNNIEDIDWICASDQWNSQLKYLILSNNRIDYELECIYDLFTNPNILYINLFGNNIDINSFDENNELNYNEKTVYYLQNNPICYTFENSPQYIEDYSTNLYSFLMHSNGCKNDYCAFTNATDLDNLCVPNLWNNNVCDEECNSSICLYDAHDCQP